MKSRQVLKTNYGGSNYSVVQYYEAKYNPFVLYEHKDGHRKTLYKFADFDSCLYTILDLRNHREIIGG